MIFCKRKAIKIGTVFHHAYRLQCLIVDFSLKAKNGHDFERLTGLQLHSFPFPRECNNEHGAHVIPYNRKAVKQDTVLFIC